MLLIAVALGTILGFGFLKALFETAMVVNSIIIGVFLISLYAAYRYIYLVNREFSLFTEFSDW